MEHCWHYTGSSYRTSTERIRDRICCWCGTLSYELLRGSKVPGHGVHAPVRYLQPATAFALVNGRRTEVGPCAGRG